MSHYDIHKVFTTEEELKLLEYIIHAGRMNYGLTKKETRQLTLKYAKSLNKIIPHSWDTDEMVVEY